MPATSFPRSSLLILSSDLSISSLIPSTLIDQVDVLLDAHKIDDASQLVDLRRKKLEGNLTVDPDEAEELQYAYQAIGFKCFGETLFEDAGRNLFNGALDPRVLVSYYPDLRGGLFSSSSEVNVFTGVAERMPPAKDIHELIHTNLVLNYHPHLSLSPSSPDPAAQELTRVLTDAAQEMLRVFLEKSRKRARVERRKEDLDEGVTRVVDTVLANLYTLSKNYTALLTLLSIPPPSSSFSHRHSTPDDPANIVLTELEPLLHAHRLLSPLAELYKRYGETEKLLNLYASCLERESEGEGDVVMKGSEMGMGIDDPMSGIFELLTGGGPGEGSKSDTQVCMKWGLWMLERGEVERGMKLLIPPDAPRRSRAREKEREKEDIALLERITTANEHAGRMYLEWLLLVRRYSNPDLHTRLAIACIDDVLKWVEDDGVLKLWRAKASSYASQRPSQTPHPHPSLHPSSSSPSTSPPPASSSVSQPSPSSQTHLPSPPPLFSRPSPSSSHPNASTPQQSFITYFASTTPDSLSKRARLKCMLMLSGSVMYDARVVLERLRSRSGESDDREGDSDRDVSADVVEGKATSVSEKERRSGGKGGVIEQVLALEYAILYGKLGNHAQALSTLVHTLRDSTSAETYCTLGGEVIPVRVALSIADPWSSSSKKGGVPLGGISRQGLGLIEWYNGLFEPFPHGGGATKGGKRIPQSSGVVAGGVPAMIRQKSVKEDVKKVLLTDLVGTYTRDVSSGVDRTTRLLESQGVHLDVVDVVTLIPDQWPISSLHTFLGRHFRRTLHSSYENLIVKNISAGQNLSVRESSYPILRDAGYVIEEHDDEGEEGEEYVNEKTVALQAEQIVDEKYSAANVLSEKIHQPGSPPVDEVVDVVVGVEREEHREERAEGGEQIGSGYGNDDGEGEDEEVIGEERSALGLILDSGDGDDAASGNGSECDRQEEPEEIDQPSQGAQEHP